MSTVTVGGRAYAAGLYWLERRGTGATARTARRLGRPFYVHHGERTGFATGDSGAAGPGAGRPGPASLNPVGSGPGGPGPEGLDPAGLGPAGLGPAGLGPEGLGPKGLPALALALLEHLDGAFWMALVEDDGGGRFALVKARDGAVLADGDEVFDGREVAVAAFERARPLGWALHATPGVGAALEGFGREIAPLDADALGAAAERAGPGIALVSAAPARGSARRRGLAALGIAGVAVAAGLWLGRDALVGWLADSDSIPLPMVAAPEPELSVSVDSAALIAACRRALIDNPPFLPAWEIAGIACHARFADAELTSLRPELGGRAVLLVRWGRMDGHAEAIARRLAETRLARWHAAQVADGRAWAAAPLGPVLRAGASAPPVFLELRAAVDRAFGTGGARVGYGRNAAGAWQVRIDDPGPLSRLGPVAGAIAGLEIVALARGASGPWRLEARPAAPERMTAARLAALGAVDGGAGPAKGISGEEEAGHAARDRDGS